jgi:AraC-like DNA-binding protein
MYERWSEVRFRFGGFGLAVYPPGAVFGPRTSRDFELVWTVDGEVAWIADGREHPMPPGSVCLVRPGMRDEFHWDAGRQSRHGFVHFELDLGPAATPPAAAWPLVRRYGEHDVVLPLLRHLNWLLAAKGPAWEELAQGAARQALLAFLAGSGAEVGEHAPEPPPAVARALARVREAWARDCWLPLSVPALARAAGVTREHLSRAFHRHFGAGPAEVMTALRLDRGAHLLARSGLGVSEIARLCGFSDPFHFSRRFRAAYRMPPSTFRERVLAGMAMPMHPLVKARWMAEQVVAPAGR